MFRPRSSEQSLRDRVTGATLANPGLLYESRIMVPAGSTIHYQNHVRNHSNTGTQFQYRSVDGVGRAEFQRTDGAVATTSSTLQTVAAFVSPSSTLILLALRGPFLNTLT